MMDSVNSMVGGEANGNSFLIGGLYVLGAVAAYCSSPQTTEINAGSRADTLMKWVNYGAIQSVLFIGIAAIIDKKHRPALVTGGALQLVFMYAAYIHAKQSGLSSRKPGTES